MIETDWIDKIFDGVGYGKGLLINCYWMTAAGALTPAQAQTDRPESLGAP
ncbi:hypothetical protein [Vulcanococcus sp. Clear-D1]|jgi:hypothetical protein|nr:hypothetical protein [Vulcanococcus sp. Clear-D1]MBD1194940.1 hypothetical protein [Vulcanococcus sp. Clear-D1]